MVFRSICSRYSLLDFQEIQIHVYATEFPISYVTMQLCSTLFSVKKVLKGPSWPGPAIAGGNVPLLQSQLSPTVGEVPILQI